MRGIVWMRYVAVAAVAAWLVTGHPTNAGAAVSDAWITAKTKIALMTSKDVHATDVNVDTMDGVVTLHGKVRTSDEKARADEEAKKITGVKEVRNLLQVVPAREEKVAKASDSQIKDHVTRALKDDPTLKDSSISVQSVNDGVVLLSGKANSVSDHLRALQDARRVPGVRQVASEIESPDRLADDEIRRSRESPTAGVKHDVTTGAKDAFTTTDVKMRLLADGRTPAMDINVDTNAGVVTLWGAVPSKEAKTAAEQDARKVSGVRRVVNELQIVSEAKKEQVKAKDDDLENAVKDRLKARDDLKSADIGVDVKNGVARLTGTVDDEAQRLAAAVAARSTPGVRSVQDDLRVKTPTS